MNISPTQPIFFMPNRTWRCYRGGALLDRFVGNAPATDGSTPEDWLASTTRALNGTHSLGADEGLSRVREVGGVPGASLADILTADPQAFLGTDSATVPILCKYLDAAVRLPIQCHPDKPFAREHYNSDHGKTESWLILDTREINGEAPYLLMGFKPGITQAAFARVYAEQNIPAMENMLHRVPAIPGDVYLIPGRFPHAIGAGVFMLEVQEASDWVVQAERFCAGSELSEYDMNGPLTQDRALSCFDYVSASLEDTLARVKVVPEIVGKAAGGVRERLITSALTDCFRIDRVTISGTYADAKQTGFYIAVVAAGKGSITVGDTTRAIKRGDVFMIPHGVRLATYTAAELLTIYFAKPGGH